MHKKTSAPLVPWPQHHYLSKPGGGGGWGVSHTRTGPSRPPPPPGAAFCEQCVCILQLAQSNLVKAGVEWSGVVWCGVPKALLPNGNGGDALHTGNAKREGGAGRCENFNRTSRQRQGVPRAAQN